MFICFKMYSKIVWCYVLILTLLDISPYTYLSAQGKSHDNINIHDTLVEGVTFQEWGKESAGREGAADGAVRLEPAALRLGRVPLAAPRAALVTLLNLGNATLHLASVAGTTPDFHASFFHSKTVPPEGNTTFSVVYLGRREGLVAAHLYIHTSLGVYKYPVSAVGVANEYEVWPLVSLRVPHNATLSALLTLTNPTDTAIQIREVYSSGAWVGLQLPEGGASAAPRAWHIPPRTRRPLVRLHIAPPAHQPIGDHTPRTAYIRIKANVSLSGVGGAGGGGGLVVAVEAARAPAGEYAQPPHVRLRVRGTRDPADTVEISLGNSLGRSVRVRGALWAARCLPAPHHPPPPPADAAPAAPGPATAALTANGGKQEEPPAADGAEGGARVRVVRGVLGPHRAPAGVDATLTLHYANMWAEYSSGTANGAGHSHHKDSPDGNGGGHAATDKHTTDQGTEEGGGAWCAGWVRLGGAALPYSVRLLPGTVALEPSSVDIITASRAEATREHAVRARNEFALPVHVARVEVSPEAKEYLEVEVSEGFTLSAGESALIARVRLRPSLSEPYPTLDSTLTVRTNVSAYTLPLRVYTGLLHLEWEWPNSADGTLRVGAVGTSSTRRVRARLRNPAPAPLALTRLRAALPGATLALPACPACSADRDCHCRLPPGGSVEAWLTLVAAAREGALQGAVWARTPHGSSAHAVTLHARAGRVAALPPRLPPAAPYAWSSAELVVESSMALRMRITELASAHEPRDPAWTFLPGEDMEFEAGRWVVGRVQYAPERLCAPRCYAGLPPDQPETAAWLERAARPDAASLRADAALAAARLALFRRAHANLTLLLHTTQVVQIPVSGSVWLAWPRLAHAGGADARLGSVRGATPLRVRLRNPSRSHALLLQPALSAAPPLLPPELNEEGETVFCQKEKCVLSDAAFSLKSWRAVSGDTREWGAPAAGRGAGAGAGALLLVAPAAELELELQFTPHDALPLATYLYLRNNLTVLESVQLAGQGAFPSFQLAEREPADPSPITLEVTECGSSGSGAAVRTVVVRNTGLVPLRLRGWRVAGAACAARGFRLQPCAPLLLPPNRTRALTLAFTADWTLARAAARLTARSDTTQHEFQLHAAVPPRLRDQCAPQAPRPPFERALRTAARLLALAVLALVLAAAALDAERLLRRARAPRSAPRAPLDLRALAAPPPRPAPAQPAAPPLAQPRRRRSRKLDPLAESRAFERWRASLRRTDDDSERSSEDNDDARPARHHDESAAEPAPDGDHERESPPPPDNPPRSVSDDDATSTDGSEASSSPVEADDAEPPPQAQRDPMSERSHSPLHDASASDAARPEPSPTPPGAGEQAVRRTEPSPRRARRSDAEPACRTRYPLLKHHARKEKGSKRRERAPPSALRVSPAGGAGGAGDARPVSGGVRVGASWSSVVARREPPPTPPPPPPVGADRRPALAHAPPALPPQGDHSLFYFNGAGEALARAGPPMAPDRDFAWRADLPPPPPPEVSGFAPPTHDYLVAGGGAEGGNAFGSIGPVLWGDSLAARAPGALWPWGYHQAVRPPPGFGAGAGAGGGAGAGAGVRGAVRAFDPFHSLASIWSRGALDWRGDDERPRE